MTRMGLVVADYLHGGASKILVTRFLPDGGSRGFVLLVPPFAEEMNRSRKMFADLGRRLTCRGYEVALPDLYGTGDSYGDFSSASLAIWKQDLSNTIAASRSNKNLPVFVLGLRLGALLALESAIGWPSDVRGILMWNPCIDGKQFMNQFLRLHVASQIIGESGDIASVEDLRAALKQNGNIEIAGYDLSSRIVDEIDCLSIDTLIQKSQLPLHWFDVTTRKDGGCSPATTRAVSKLEQSGCRLTVQAIPGPPFWGTAELAHCQPLIDATAELLAHYDGV